MLQDKNKYQVRLRALQQQLGPPRAFDQNSTSTEASVTATLDTDTSIDPNKQSPSRRSSGRSVRIPRSPQTASQLDSLQASLEAEIAKTSDNSELAPTSARRLGSSGSDIPRLAVDGSSPHISPHIIGGKIKRVPTPLDLSPARVRASEPSSQSFFLAPRSGSPRMGSGRLSPYRDSPPLAPSVLRTFTPDQLSPAARPSPPLVFSPGLPKSPRAFLPTVIPLSPLSGEIISDDTQSRVQDSAPPSTPRSKSLTEPDDLTDSSMSPTTPAPPSPSSRDALVEAARKSPLVPRRSRIPSHRSNPSTSHTSTSSIVTINGPTSNGPIITTTSPVASRSSRSMSLEFKEPPGRSLIPPQEALERRKSRSFEDLHSLSNSFEQMQKDESDKSDLTKDSDKTSEAGIRVDEKILEMQRAHEQYSPPSLTESPQRTESHPFPEPPKRPAPPTPPQHSPTAVQTPVLQPPFTAKSHSASSASKLVPLVINPNEIPSISLSVLSVRSRQVPASTGAAEETLFTIRCRLKNNTDKFGDKEILRVEKPLASLRELGDKLGSGSGMAPFLKSFFDDFPIEKSDQRKVRLSLT